MSEKLGSGYEKTGEIDQLVAEQLKNASEVFLKIAKRLLRRLSEWLV